MDELKLNLTTKFMRGILAKCIAKTIRKKLGCNMDVLINEIKITAVDGKIHIHADVDGETTNEDLMKMIKAIGLD